MEKLSNTLLVPISHARSILSSLCAQHSATPTDAATLNLWLDSIPTVESPDGPAVHTATLENALSNFLRYIENGDPFTLNRQTGFKTPPPTIDQFIESREYLDLHGSIWPGVKDNLRRIFDPDPDCHCFEVVLTGCISGGKSTTSQLALAYILCLLGHLHNPHHEFGLMPGTAIVLLVQSLKLDKAVKLIFEPLKNLIDASPWFAHNFPRNKDINSELRFPHNVLVLPATSADTAALGLNIFTSVITEINFMPVIRNSKKTAFLPEDIYDQGKEMIDRARERIVSRFPRCKQPGFFGRLIMDSSVNHPEDLTHQKMEEARKDPTILVIKKSIWEAQPHAYPADEPRFFIEVGDSHRSSRILSDERGITDANNPDSVIAVPTSLRPYFDADIEEALKNYAGIATGLTGVFIPFKDKIDACQTAHANLTGGRSLFRFPEVSLFELFGRRNHGEPIDWDLLIDTDYIEDCVADPSTPFSLRIDLSATEDATGLAICRISGYQLMDEALVYDVKTGRYQEQSGVTAPIYCVDGLLRIVARHGEEIDVMLVAALGIELKRLLNIRFATADRAESSRAVLQLWRSAKIMADFMSVDADLLPYTETKNAIREGRLIFPTHEVCDRELKNVQKSTRRGKTIIDHPATGTKDVADALVGAIFALHVKEGWIRSHQRDGRRERRNGTASPQGRNRGEGRRLKRVV